MTVVLHAVGCQIVGCSTWVGTGTAVCMPTPCRCEQSKAAAPDWLKALGGPISCWWTDRRTGKIKSRCDCWGTPRDGRPGACCAHHSGNPLYGTVRVDGIADAEPDPDADTTAVQPTGDDTTPGETEDSPFSLDWYPTAADRAAAEAGVRDDWRDDWPDEERKPYVRRWEPEELTCPCVLPYQKDKRSAALHCTTCCLDFGNAMAYDMHRPDWTKPCTDPADLADCWTGEPVMVCQGGIWRLSFESSYAPDGWTPGKMTTTR